MGCLRFLKKKLKKTKQQKIDTSAASTNNETSQSEGSNDSKTVQTLLTKSSASASSARSIPELYEERAHHLREFSITELSIMTNDFSRLRKIGEGGFGSVYKGSIPADGTGEKTVVAVKKLNPNSLQGHRQWLAEVQFLGVVEHPNLVKLIGYCAADGERGLQRMLVYEFMPNKSLDYHLFNKACPTLHWHRRLLIALGSAEGLLYLHEGLEVQVIFRDFKASNILLDDEFRPKLSDFGLAREGPPDGKTHVTTAVMGTHGYAAPDYIASGHLTAKSDVWSFGVVLYEILTGRRSMEKNLPKNEQNLLEWVEHYPPESSKFNRIIDPRLENLYSAKAARDIALLANSCLSKLAKDRPGMRQVVERLKQAMQQEELDGTAAEDSFEESVPTEEDRGRGSVPESRRRRMLHLEKLSLNAGAAATKRRFQLMTGDSPT